MLNKLNQVRALALVGVMAAWGALAPLPASASAISVFVGYADSLRPSPFFPSPYDTADIFQGNVGALDTGAIRIQNTGASDIFVNDLSASFTNGGLFKLWNFGAAGTGNFDATGLVLHPGQNAVFASTANYNFDTSDFGVLGANAPVNDNCSVGPASLTALCINSAPVVTFWVNGVANAFSDTGHVLDTGGYDFVNSNPCPVAGDTPGSCNESLQWRLIGTTGVQDPGGNGVPEPSSIALVLLALGLAGNARRRRG